jgi:hypothetical protein
LALRARLRNLQNKKRPDFSERFSISIFPNASRYAFFFAFNAFNANVRRDL